MTPQNGVVRYTIDPKASQFTVQAFADGLISAVAHSPRIAIREWVGDVSFVPGTLSNAKLKMTIKAASLEVIDELRDSDRRTLQRVMYDDVLETRSYPEVTFDSSGVGVERLRDGLYRVNIEGRLSLHGSTNVTGFSSQVAFGVDTFRAYGEFTLLQTDYGIVVASIAGGTLKLQDELKFRFYVVGRKQEQPEASSKAMTRGS
jgi:polyisoprenoid-binding protein YceI